MKSNILPEQPRTNHECYFVKVSQYVYWVRCDTTQNVKHLRVGTLSKTGARWYLVTDTGEACQTTWANLSEFSDWFNTSYVA